MLKRFVARRISGVLQLALRSEADRLKPHMESVYQSLVMRDLARLNIEDKYYPVGIAANYGLLYVLLRLVQEFQIGHLVELGGGQTTLLVSALMRARVFAGTAVTVESDPEFAKYLGDSVAHKVISSVPVNREIDGIAFKGFDLSGAELAMPINLLLVDGPVAATPETAFNRLGSLDLAARMDRHGFAIVIDDAERCGEARLCQMFAERLQSTGMETKRFDVVSNKRQHIIVGGSYRRAAFF